jgi:hypothetical protein
MNTDVVTAKKELYNQLKKHSGVTGAGIREKKGTEYVVIFLSDANEKLRSLIPSEYKGNKVTTEVRAVAKAL